MAKRSITDNEIALIKAMIARGMKNKDIQFYFNRPDRPVNSGRITGIGAGTYSNSAEIPAAPDSELDEFLANAKSPKSPPPPPSPSSEDYVRSMFSKHALGHWQLTGGESDTRECKSNFGFKHAYQWLKAVAALANTHGGHVFFGVADGDHRLESGEEAPHAVVGLNSDDFATADPADVTSKLKAYLDPTPRVERLLLDFDGRKVGVFYVDPHPSRPVIATKQDGDKIKEGDIFYRYPGQSNRIKYSDLRALLDHRDAQARSNIIPMVERLLQLGPERALLADLEQGQLHDGKQSILIDPTLVEQIKFIREGSFDEVDGAPALKLVGNVVAKGDEGSIQSRGAITDETLLTNFLKQETISQPREYIRYAAGAGHASWLPLRYFASKGNLDRAGTLAAIKAADGTSSRKASLNALIRSDRSAFHLFPGSPKAVLAKLEAGEVPEPTDPASASGIAQAICGLKELTPVSGPTLLALIAKCRDYVQGKPAMSYVRRAACRVDELMFPFVESEPPPSLGVR